MSAHQQPTPVAAARVASSTRSCGSGSSSRSSAGILFGLVAPDAAKKADWLADAFLQLIKTVTGPVIFVTVVIGISSLGNLARAGGLALRALGYFLVMTVIALTLGLLAGNIIAPGSGFDSAPIAENAAKAKEAIGEAGTDSGFVAFLTNDLLPTSFLSAVRRQQDPPDPRAGDPHRVRGVDARRRPAPARGRRLRARQPRDLRDDQDHHVGGADRRLRRHGVHRRAVRRRVAGQPRPAGGHLLGDVRDLRLRRARARLRGSAASASSA